MNLVHGDSNTIPTLSLPCYHNVDIPYYTTVETQRSCTIFQECTLVLRQGCTTRWPTVSSVNEREHHLLLRYCVLQRVAGVRLKISQTCADTLSNPNVLVSVSTISVNSEFILYFILYRLEEKCAKTDSQFGTSALTSRRALMNSLKFFDNILIKVLVQHICGRNNKASVLARGEIHLL